MQAVSWFPVYVILLIWLFLSLSPLLLLRARSRRAQFAGFLVPMAIVLTARVVVPALVRPAVYPLYISPREASLSVLALILLTLPFCSMPGRMARRARPTQRMPTNAPPPVC